MTQVNLTKIANLLTDTFIGVEEVSVIENHIFVTFHAKNNLVEVAHAMIPEADDPNTVCALLLNLQNQVTQNTHPAYFSHAQ